MRHNATDKSWEDETLSAVFLPGNLEQMTSILFLVLLPYNTLPPFSKTSVLRAYG